jgi:magnesium-transporting ATPase (P-type)
MSSPSNPSPKRALGDLHRLEEKELIAKLETNFETGLHEHDAKERLAKHGPNELEEEEGETFWDKIKEQFEDRMVRLLLLAAVISFVVGLTSKQRVIKATMSMTLFPHGLNL